MICRACYLDSHWASYLACKASDTDSYNASGPDSCRAYHVDSRRASDFKLRKTP